MKNDAWQLQIQTVMKVLNDVWTARGVRLDDDAMKQRFFQVTNAMRQTHQAALESDESKVLINKLNAVESRVFGDAELFGFALEGIGIGLSQQDLVSPCGYNRVDTFLEHTTSTAYRVMVYLGVGLMLGKGLLPIERYLERSDSVKVWPIIDGYGFQHGLFHWRKFLDATASPPELFSGYTRHIFDQGLGRSIWMVSCADVTHIAKTIRAFPKDRQADLWGGVGYACASIGGAEPATLEALVTAADSYRFALARAAACAAKFRQLLGNSFGYTKMASEVLSGLETATPDTIIHQAHIHLPVQGSFKDPDVWQFYRTYLISSDLEVADKLVVVA
jgi:enediyne biosynthesis protein E3